MSWNSANPQLLVSGSQDGSFSTYRYSKSKQKIERKNNFKMKKNFGVPKSMNIEIEKFLLVAYDTNILVIYEFLDSPLEKNESKLGLISKRIFKNSFEIPFTAHAAHRKVCIFY